MRGAESSNTQTAELTNPSPSKADNTVGLTE